MQNKILIPSNPNVETLSSIIWDVQLKTEENILRQLGDLVKKDLLRIEMHPSILVYSENSDSIELKQPITLKLKDQEYIESLEEQIKILTQRVKDLSK